MGSHSVLARIRSITEKCPNALNTVSLIELVGQRRVLIEHHMGVLAYSLNEIQIKVSFGKLSVMGNGLYLSQLSREQLVIQGEIQSLQLSGGAK